MLSFLKWQQFYFLDIKPENLLISNTGLLKLCDFGKYKLGRFHHNISKWKITFKGFHFVPLLLATPELSMYFGGKRREHIHISFTFKKCLGSSTLFLLTSIQDLLEVSQIRGRVNTQITWPPGGTVHLSFFWGRLVLFLYVWYFWNNFCWLRSENISLFLHTSEFKKEKFENLYLVQ